MYKSNLSAFWFHYWFATKFQTDSHAPQRMNPADFDDLLVFPLTSPAGQSFYLAGLA